MRQQQLVALVGAIILSGSIATGAVAHHRQGHGGGPPAQTTEPSANSQTTSTPANLASYATLTTAQRTFLASLLRGTSDYDYLITETLRDEIQSQIDTLPPGIQRQLARGHELPPGIAKKVTLPVTVNNQLGVDDDLEIIVLGPNAVIVDPLTDQVIDLLSNIF
jgi:hypothetical protein